MSVITTIHGRQVFDSRGRPTVEVEIGLDNGVVARASVPSGASTGTYEAHEHRDGDKAFFDGLGVLSAVGHVNGEIADALRGRSCEDQRGSDALLRELDGTPTLSRLGANAVLGTSLALCRAAALDSGRPLYRRIAELAGITAPTLPMPMVNILSGGLHAGRGMDVQDFLAVPIAATSILEAIHLVARVRNAAAAVCAERGLPTLLADEGGLSPGCRTGRDALELFAASVERAGLTLGVDIAIAIDVAATALFDRAGGDYHLRREGRRATTDEMIDMVASWVDEFPILSIEDALDEEDWAGWQALTKRLGHRVRLIGDDLFTTNPQRLAKGVEQGCANGVLVKINQNGTLTGTLDVVAAATAAGYVPVVSARSGETEDDFLADLAVGTAAGQIKVGSVRSSERLAKYNQLVRIAEDPSLTFAQLRLPCTGARDVTAPDSRTKVLAFLRKQGLLSNREEAQLAPLTGGVSSDLWRVDLPGRTVCVKSALAQLNVAQEWLAPVSRNRVEYDWLRFAATVAPGQVPRVLADDPDAGLFAMEFLPPPRYPVWKTQLLAGNIGMQAARSVGDLVGRLHAASAADPDSAHRFATDDNFDALRIEPYLRATARAHPDLRGQFATLAAVTAGTHLAVVHGDVSPKNILLGPSGPVLLDAECAWFGDPAFDVAFCVNHLLLKSVALPHLCAALRSAAGALIGAHRVHISWEPPQRFDQRVAALLPALALARVDGTSPVEYLDAAQKDVVRAVSRTLLLHPAAVTRETLDGWARSTADTPATQAWTKEPTQ